MKKVLCGVSLYYPIFLLFAIRFLYDYNFFRSLFLVILHKRRVSNQENRPVRLDQYR